MRGLQIWTSHVFERYTNPTFSHIHISHTCLQPTKVPTTFGDLRESEPWRFHHRAISRYFRSRSWSLDPKVLVFELVLLSNPSSPSAWRRWHPSSPKVLVFALPLPGSHPSPSACRRWYPSHRRLWSLSSRSLVFVRYLRVCLAPSRLGPANRLGDISEGEGLTRRCNPQQNIKCSCKNN